MTGLNGHLWVSVFAEIGAKRCQDSGEGWVTTRSCSVNFKISELGLLTCVFFYFRKKTRSLQSQYTREDCIYYISPVNFILKWLCSLKVAKCKCLLLLGSSLMCSFLQHSIGNCCVHHTCASWSWVREQRDLLGDVGPGHHGWVIPSLQLTSWIWGRFCLFSYTVAWAVALKSLYVQFGLVRKCSRNILWGTLGDGLWRLSPPLNGALGGTGLD